MVGMYSEWLLLARTWIKDGVYQHLEVTSAFLLIRLSDVYSISESQVAHLAEIQPHSTWVREMSCSRWTETAQGRFAYLLSCSSNGKTVLSKIVVSNEGVAIETVQEIFQADNRMTTAIYYSGDAFVFSKSRCIYLIALSGDFELKSFEIPRGQAVSGMLE